MVPLRSDTIWLVQNECSFHGLQSEDPNQHLKDFLKLGDSLDLDGENRERTCLRLFQCSLRDQANNWLEHLLAGSITTCEDLTTRLRRFFRYAMFNYSFYLCYSLSLYPFTERYAQPYFFSCLIRQRGVTRSVTTDLKRSVLPRSHLETAAKQGNHRNTRNTWTHFLRSKDETPKVLIDFLRLVQRGLQAQVRIVRTDKGTEFLNQTLHAYFAAEGILHQTSVAQTTKQNGVVERRNRTLVEAARTMLSATKVPLFFWAEAISTTCFTQNRSLVIPRHEKTPYHIINDRKPSVKFFYIFGCLCYIARDGENLDKMKEKGDACIFVGYSNQSRAYRVFNKRTRVIVETIHVNFDELPQMASDHVSSDPAPKYTIVTTSNELDLLFSPMFDELLNGSYQVVSKSSAVSTTDAPNQRQQQNITPLNNLSTPDPTYGEMYMFALTVSRTEPKNIQEAMADSAWIESMQEELHQFDRLDVWELVDRPLFKNVINMKWLWKNKRDEENTVIRNKSRLVAKRYAQKE
nr:Gag-Pol polyprotein [Tanacetum cinerariifolium]